VLTALLSDGHVLLEDVPGTGKTVLAKALANTLDGTNSRIQFTPDLLPSDVTGVTIFDQTKGRFEFHRGPIFASVVLADEINRASPTTQSALLEVMEEGRVTVDGVGYEVERPFMVIATQNPVEQAGTYALPEAQLDRFMVRLSVGYPDRAGEQRVLLNRVERRHEVADVDAVVTSAEMLAMQAAVERVHVDADIALYCVDLAAATRASREVQVGASPRGAQALMLVARARAVMDARDFVTPEDVKSAAVPVLAHRISLTPQAWANGVDPAEIVRGVVAQVAGPPVVGSAQEAR
jgi:MoxR-like ATPase